MADKTAKDIISIYLKSEGHSIVNSKENYYADIETTKDSECFFHEAEMKYSWKGKWPDHWSEIRIPSQIAAYALLPARQGREKSPAAPAL